MNPQECPQCGAPINPHSKVCEYCKAEIFVTNLAYLSRYDFVGVQKYLKHYREILTTDPNSSEGLIGIGLCYLQTETYPLAQEVFKKLISVSPELPSGYYYYSLSLIAGKNVRSLSYSTAEKIFTNMRTAMTLDANMLYILLLMVLQHDFYKANSIIQHSPKYEELLAMMDYSELDMDEVEKMKIAVKTNDWSVYNV